MLDKELKKRILRNIPDIQGPGLLKGRMGLCVYLFVMGRKRKDEKMSRMAEGILRQILGNLQSCGSLDFAEGLTGEALGLTYLVQENYVEGDVNDILLEVDQCIFKKVSGCFSFPCERTGHDLPMLDVLLYEICRYRQIESPCHKKLVMETIIEVFNWIYQHRTNAFYEEPFPFSLQYDICIYMAELLQIMQLGIERERIARIFREMKYFLFSHCPRFHGNRLYLATVAAYVARELADEEWQAYSDELAGKTDVSEIFEVELLDKDIFLTDGIVGAWVLVQLYNKIHSTQKIRVELDSVKERIVNSSFWDKILIDKVSLLPHYSLDGFCGIDLFLNYIQDMQAYGK